QLKKHVKKVKLSRLASSHTTNSGNHDYGLSIFDPVRSLLRRISSNNHLDPPDDLNHDQILQVKSTEQHDGDGDVDVDGQAELEDDETELANHLYSEEEEVKAFFEKLDEELDKVNQFYTDKETEFLERG
ncbi:phosphate transporter PHO1, partial [Tanacetum coccineum]